MSFKEEKKIENLKMRDGLMRNERILLHLVWEKILMRLKLLKEDMTNKKVLLFGGILF